MLKTVYSYDMKSSFQFNLSVGILSGVVIMRTILVPDLKKLLTL
jgi:hypothetical protein